MTKAYKHEWRKKQIRVKTFTLLSAFSLEVELAVHTGGRICYGMLAAQVKPHSEPDCVKLSLAYTQENTIKYEDTCLFDGTYAYRGLPREYASAVMDKMHSSISQKESFPQCEIVFEDSANCEVGSSPMIFGSIAEIITNIICLGSVDEILDLNIETFTKLYAESINLRY